MTGVEVQVLQLRTEMRDEFSAIRGEMATKTDLAEGLAAVRREMATKDDVALLRTDLANNELADLKRELREDIAGMGRDLGQIILDTQRAGRRGTESDAGDVRGDRVAAEGSWRGQGRPCGLTPRLLRRHALQNLQLLAVQRLQHPRREEALDPSA